MRLVAPAWLAPVPGFLVPVMGVGFPAGQLARNAFLATWRPRSSYAALALGLTLGSTRPSFRCWMMSAPL